LRCRELTNHVEESLLDGLPLSEAGGPIVACPASVLGGHKDILLVEQVLDVRVLDAVDHSRLEVQKKGPGNVVIIVSLVEEDVLAVAPLSGKVLQDPVLPNAVL
jgi:hypothetical protein